MLPSIKIETLSPDIELNGIIYYKDLGLTIYGTEKGKVSYRMTANRFDWRGWVGYKPESLGLIIPEEK